MEMQGSVATYASPAAGVGRDGTLAITTEDEPGIVRVTGRGLWTPDEVDSHFDELDPILQAERRARGGALVLVDLHGAPVQPIAVADRIRFHTSRMYRPEDRVAIIVRSSFVKVQMKRAAAVAHLEVFISPDAARIWLTAHVRAAAR